MIEMKKQSCEECRWFIFWGYTKRAERVWECSAMSHGRRIDMPDGEHCIYFEDRKDIK